jgi:hypothetical protein
MDDVLKKLSEVNEIEAYMLEAANNQLVMVLGFLRLSDIMLSPKTTRTAMELNELVTDGAQVNEVWRKYIELIKEAEEEGIDLPGMPLRLFNKNSNW